MTIHESSTERPDARRIPLFATYVEWKEHSSAFEQLEYVGRQTETSTYPGVDGAERYASQSVSSGLFRFMGVEPILDRNFVAEDEDGEAIILSYGFWQRRFGGDLDIAGQTWANQTVVGVMPPGFRIFSWHEADFWLSTGWEDLGTEDLGALGWSLWWEPIGRLNRVDRNELSGRTGQPGELRQRHDPEPRSPNRTARADSLHAIPPTRVPLSGLVSSSRSARPRRAPNPRLARVDRAQADR